MEFFKVLVWTLPILLFLTGCGRLAPSPSEELQGGVLVEDLEGRARQLAQLGEDGNSLILVFRPACPACKRILGRLRRDRPGKGFIGLAAVSRPYLEKYVVETAPEFPVYLTTENRLFRAGIRQTPALLIWRGNHWQIEYDADTILHVLSGRP
jgi:hypothetical protein